MGPPFGYALGSSTAGRPPLTQIPKAFELVGLTYSGWFTYRYLLFKSSREELVKVRAR
jgi:hypothetical protein